MYPPQQPPYPPQQPPEPRQRNWLVRRPRNTILAAIGGLLVVCAACTGIVTAMQGGNNAANTTSPTATTSSSGSAHATSTPKPAPKPKAWTTIQHFTGSQNQQTATFHIPDGARIVWSETLTDPNANLFAVTMYNSDGSVNDLIVDNANETANQSSTYNVHGDLDVYLKIDAGSVNYDIAVQVYQ